MYHFTHKRLVINTADLIVDTQTFLFTHSITLDWVATLLNLAVNTVATLLIVYRAWFISIFYPDVISTHSGSRTHHKSVRSISRKKTQVEALLLLFIESGAVLAVIQVCEFLICLNKNLECIGRCRLLLSTHWM